MIYPCFYIFIRQVYSKTHKGIDIGRVKGQSPLNPPILSILDGTVYKIVRQVKGGKVLVIKHKWAGIDFYSLYAHLKTVDVKIGDRVIKGQQVALMGDTGVTTGVHLHFELYKGKYKLANRVDPMDYLFLTAGMILSKSTAARDLQTLGETRNVTTTCKVRTSPYVKKDNVTDATLKKGSKVKIYGYEYNDDYGWFKISPNGELWSASKYLKRG